MKTKNVTITKIKEIYKNRRLDDSFEIVMFFDMLLTRINKDDSQELLTLVPIRIVACLESFFRGVFSNLINTEPTARKGLANELKDFKLTISFQDELNANSLSIGDFIAFQIPFSSPDQINNTMKAMLGVDLFDTVREQNNGQQLLEEVFDIYEKRHILAHESALNVHISREQAISYLNSAKALIEIVEGLFNPPLNTSKEMIDYELAEFEKYDGKLTNLINILNNAFGDDDDNDTFGYIEIWKKYRKEKAEYKASFYEGGSLQPLIYLCSLTETTVTEFNSLREKYSHILRSLDKSVIAEIYN